jgi:methyltransferase family protein
MGSWEECKSIIQEFNAHYTIGEDDQERIYELCQQIPQNGLALEIGVCHGRTAAVLGYCARNIGFEAHGVDPYVLEGNGAEVQSKLDSLNLPYTLHITTSMGLIWDRPLDLLIIDGNHMDPYVTQDTEKYVPLIKIGGVVAFDDYVLPMGHPPCAHEAICRQVNKLKANPNWELLRDGRLAILKRLA